VARAAFAAEVEQGVEQQGLGGTAHEAGAERAQDRGVRAGVGRGEPKQGLPIDGGAHGIGGAAVGQVLGDLQQRDERQPPGAGRGLTIAGDRGGERGVGVDRAEGVAQAELGVAEGERGVGDGDGAIETPDVRRAVTRIVEGGLEAFALRARKYGVEGTQRS